MPEGTDMIELSSLFRTLVRRMTYKWKAGASQDDSLSMSQFKMLHILSSRGEQKTYCLAEVLGLTSGAITAIADRLVERGFIERERSEEDRRVVHLRITEQGEKKLEAMLGQQDSLISTFFEGLPQEDIAHLKRIFTVMLEHYDMREKE